MPMLPIVVRDPLKSDDDEKALTTMWYEGQLDLHYISHGVYNHDGLEFQLESTIAQFHGDSFASKYALALVNDSSTLDISLENLAGDWFINYCESKFKEID